MSGKCELSSARGLVSGRVQGVGFRYFVRQKAVALGVVGYARNLPDGRVEVELTGSSVALDALRKQIEQGPPASQVHDVEWGAIVQKKFIGFDIQ